MSLASRYRPQTFAQVVGQQLAARALSRAAATRAVAPAYLLSGTRGVGKTTIARIFAKALNCEKGPAPEPCNDCGSCRRVTAGNHVDVTEIDAASNTGVEDVRALRETIGFAPMEGRYKIFIVDEAHMLSKSAFNALLKTLEEPPPKAVFIFATTEAHKFPATIISRCQHFVFRHLPEEALFGHLSEILKQENIPYDEGAVHLLARRAQGSARDSLSLLDQALAISEGTLTAERVREALGLAGMEFFGALVDALSRCDVAGIIKLSRHLLGSGVDIGFFIRELAANLRNLFLFRQAGESILPALELAADEADFLKCHAPLFSAAHLHAAWQMTLEAQRGIIMSPEPGVALELLLLNLAMLPQLLPIARLPDAPPETTPGQNAPPPQTGANNALPPPVAGSAHPARESGFSEAKKKSESAPLNEHESTPRGPAAGTADEAAAAECGAPKGGVQPDENWRAFREFCESNVHLPKDIFSAPVQWSNGKITFSPMAEKLHERLRQNEPAIVEALGRFCNGQPPRIEILEPAPAVSRRERIEACANLPEIREVQDILGGKIIDCKKRI